MKKQAIVSTFNMFYIVFSYIMLTIGLKVPLLPHEKYYSHELIEQPYRIFTDE